jgi:hypothetical protein
VSADYVHTVRTRPVHAAGSECRRAGQHRRERRNRPPNPAFVTSVNTRSNVGEYDYDGLNVQFERRTANGWSGRVSYTLAYSRGNTNGDYTAPINFQLLDDLNLDANQGPTDRDRRHNLVISGRGEDPAHRRNDRRQRRCEC